MTPRQNDLPGAAGSGAAPFAGSPGRGWPELPAALRAIATRPNEAGYGPRSGTYLRRGAPALILAAGTEPEAAAAVRYAAAVRERAGELSPGRVPFSVRSGGHGLSGSGTNDGGIVLDLSGLAQVRVAGDGTGRFTAQAGATWGRVAAALGPQDRALSSGNIGGTGVGGLITAGGVGFFARAQGLSLDHVQRLRVLDGRGNVRWVDAERDAERFWALRGGATQAGIVLEAVLDAPRLGSSAGDASVIHQEVQYLLTDLPGFVEAWGDWMREAPREAESFLMLQARGDGRTMVQARNVWANDHIEQARATLEAALGLAPVLGQQAVVVPYPRLVPDPGRTATRSPIEMRSALVNRADATLGAALEQTLGHRSTMLAELRALGGAVADVPSAATAWAGRHQEALVATWAHPDGARAADEGFAPVRALGSGSYGAYATETGSAAAERAWPGATGTRLRAVADRVDPDRLFDAGLVLSPHGPG